MGTSCRIFIYYKEKFVVDKLAARDGYIGGQGVYLLNFLRHDRNVQQLKKGLKYIKYITEDRASHLNWEIDEKHYRFENLAEDWLSFCQDVDADLSQELQEMHISVHPNTGGAILKLISDYATKQNVQLVKELDCPRSFEEEWYYVVDLDKSRLEVFSGLEEQHPKHRFFDHYRTTGGVPRLNCAYTFKALESLREKEFIEYHTRICKDGPTLEPTRGLVPSFRIKKLRRLKASKRTKRRNRDMLLKRLFTKQNGSGQKQLAGQSIE